MRFPRQLHEKSGMFIPTRHRQTLHSLSETKTILILFSYKIFNKYDFQKYIARSTHYSQVCNTKEKKKKKDKVLPRSQRVNK